jgi:hypothetical protein
LNATDTEDRIREGFAELLAHLRALDQPPPSDRIKANTKAREEARNRVWNEYGALGLTPPHEDALSITALRSMGYTIPQPASEAAE